MTTPGPYRPGPPPGGPRPGPPMASRPPSPSGDQRPMSPSGDDRPMSPSGDHRPTVEPVRPAVDGSGTGHPAVDAVVESMANAADLPPADQIAQYEAAHRTLQETLATIDHG